MSRKFKPGDRVKIIPNEEVLNYIIHTNGDISSIFTIDFIIQDINEDYTIHARSKEGETVSFRPSELRLYIEDNAINRLLYPELKPNEEGYLE
jgi:hypothetical protein